MTTVLFIISSICYTLSLLFSLLEQDYIKRSLFIIGILFNIGSIFLCCYKAYPLAPIFQKGYFIPLTLAIISMKDIYLQSPYSKGLLLLIFLLCSTFIFFPNNFYLPFIQTNTTFSYIFLFTIIIGNSFFIIVGIYAIYALKHQINIRNLTKYVIWGVFFQSISMISGEIWSYLGSGNPIVWNDVNVLGYMSIWFYFIGILHLFLIKKIKNKYKIYTLLLGSLITFIFFIMPEIGSFSIPQIKFTS